MIDSRTLKTLVLAPPLRWLARIGAGVLIASMLGGGVALAEVSAEISAAVADTNEEVFVFSAERVFAVGDVHGAYDQLVELLRANLLIDDAKRWSGGDAHLVSLGDLLDRGARSRDVMDLLQRLQVEARVAGGRVHVLLGNHEVMNLTGDLRDVSPAEFAAFADVAPPSRLPGATAAAGLNLDPPGYAGHRRAFAAEGKYGRWLLSLPVLIQINDTVFTHGGLSPLLGDRGLAALNVMAKTELVAAVRVQDAGSQPFSLLGAAGPLWYRGSAACHPLLEAPVVKKQLAGLSARRLVIGHTPTPTRRVRTRLDGQVYVIDTGMLESVYRGAPFLLAFDSSVANPEKSIADAVVLDAKAQISAPQWWHPLLTHTGALEQALAQQVRDGATLPGQWVKAGKKASQRAQALWRLDRELQLWMTPMAIADFAGKRYFAVSRTGPDAWITERQRREQGRSDPNYCADGHQNLLIAAFDALTGVTTRSLDTLLVHRATGARRLAATKRSFGTSSVLAAYSIAPTLPAAMEARLRALSVERLRELLGDLLTERQIKALMVRRDKVLEWPATLPTISFNPARPSMPPTPSGPEKKEPTS